MTWSRRSVMLVMVLALLGTACSRFAPKAGVGIKPVGVDLAFGVDVEELISETPAPFIPPTPVVTFPTPTSSSTITPPPPPEPDLCPPPKTTNVRDGAAPKSIVDRREFEPDQETGGRPRAGDYLTYFEGNRSGGSPKTWVSYLTVTEPATDTPNGNFNFDVEDPFTRIEWKFAIVHSTSDEGQSNDNVAGIYLEGIEVPYDSESGKTGHRRFVMNGNGAKITPFPIEAGNRTSSTVPIPTNSSQIQPPDGSSDPTLPTFTGSTILTLDSVVSDRDDRVFVCDQIASAWVINMTIEIEGETELKINGNFWFATQYGGWPIRQSYTIRGGTEFLSGNVYESIMRLDPRDVV